MFPGLCVLRVTTADKQAHPGLVHGQPRVVHEEEETRSHWRPADEGSGAGRTPVQTVRAVSGAERERERGG